MPASPLIMGLLGTAAILATGVCLVLAALCRKHYSRPLYRPDTNSTKHIPMEAVINADDLIVDGSITGIRTPCSSEHGITAEAIRNGNMIEATDPDIIRNQYERRPLHGFMQVYEYEPPKCREDNILQPEDEGGDLHGGVYSFTQHAKDISPQMTSVPTSQMMYRSLQRPNRTPSGGVLPPISGSQTLMHKYRGPEVVTTSNRIQESCI